MRRMLANIALLLASLTLAVGGIEVALRIHNPFHQRVRFGSIVLPKNRVETLHNDKVPDVPATVVKRRNSLGFRGAEPPADFAAALTVMTVGGSTTEASYEPDGLTWTDRLGERLAPCFTDFWINNAGLDGHTTFGHLVLMRDYLAQLRPDVVILLVGANDRWTSGPSHWDRETGIGAVDFTSIKGLGKSIAVRLETVALLLNVYRSLRAWRHGAWYERITWESLPEGDPYPPNANEALAKYRNSQIPAYRVRVTTLAQLARDAGILPIFVTEPIVFGPVRDPRTGKDLRRVHHGAFELERLELYNDALRDVAVAERVPLIDLARRMPHDTGLFFDTVHYTSRGEEMVADLVAPEVRAILATRFPAHVRPECRPALDGAAPEPPR